MLLWIFRSGDGLIKVADEGSSRYTATAKISSQWTNWMKFNYSPFVRKDYHRPQSWVLVYMNILVTVAMCSFV